MPVPRPRVYAGVESRGDEPFTLARSFARFLSALSLARAPCSTRHERMSRSKSRSAKNVKTMAGEVAMYSNSAVASDGWGDLRYGRSSWTRSKDGASPSCVTHKMRDLSDLTRFGISPHLLRSRRPLACALLHSIFSRGFTMGAGTQTNRCSLGRSERGPGNERWRVLYTWRAASHIACAVGAVLAEKLDAALLGNGGEKKGEKCSTLCVTLDSRARVM
ncbi:hypothetical protein B0H14DRAFT_2969377 [Mycena olivaceomarginata]|nr:hypothetical protein B0H14DRAFT_2969377 [Mycena olivaceomarginata]